MAAAVTIGFVTKRENFIFFRCIRTMFTGFMVDASNILRFEGIGAQTLDSQYSVEWWVFKPKNSGQQVIFPLHFTTTSYSQ